MEPLLDPLFTWLKRATEEERLDEEEPLPKEEGVDEEEPFRCVWTCLKCWIKLLQKIEPDADGVPALSVDNLEGIASYVAERTSLFYQCKASHCLNHRRVVEGDRCALAETTVLLLYWAVQCRPNEHFIEAIQALDEDRQLSIMGAIKKAAEQIDEQGALLHGTISIISSGTVEKDTSTSGVPSDCSPILSTPKRPAHHTLLATPTTRSRMYYSGLNSPAAIRWLCSPAMCPATRVGILRRTAEPELSKQVTHSTDDSDVKAKEVTQLRKHVKTLEESLHNQTSLLDASEADYQALSKDMAKLRYENEVLTAEVSQVQAYKDKIDEMDSMRLQIAQLEKTNARLEQVLSRLSEKKSEEVKQLEEESARKQGYIQELEKALEERKNSVVAVQLQLQATQRRAARQEALAEAAEEQLTKLKEENNEHRSEKFTVSCQVLDLKQQLTELEAKCDHLSQDNLLLEERKGELLRQAEQLQCQVEAVRTAGEVHAQEALDNLRTELQALQESVLAEERAAGKRLVEATQQAHQKELLMERVAFERLLEKEREGHSAAMEAAKKAFEKEMKETEDALQNTLKDEQVVHVAALKRERMAGQLQFEEAESTHQLEMTCQRESLQNTLEEERMAHTAAMALEGKVLELKLDAVKTALQEVIDEEQVSHVAALEENNLANQSLLAETRNKLEAERVSCQELLAGEREGHIASLAEARSSHEAAMNKTKATLLKTFERQTATQQSTLKEIDSRISILCSQMEEERMNYLLELQSTQLELEKERRLCQETLGMEQKEHQEVLDQAMRSHRQELERVQAAHQREHKEMEHKLQQEHQEMLDQATRTHRQELERVQTAHQREHEEMEHKLQQEHQEALDLATRTHCQELERVQTAHQKEHEEMEHKLQQEHQEVLDQATRTHRQELERVQTTHQREHEEMEHKLQQEHQEVLDQATRTHRQELERVQTAHQREHEEMEHKLQQEHQEVLDQATRTHRQELERVQTAHQREHEEMEHKLQQEHQEVLDQAMRTHHQKLESMQAAHQREHEEMEHKLQQEHQEVLDQATRTHRQELERVQTAHQREHEEMEHKLQQEQQEALDQAMRTHHQKLESMQAAHQREHEEMRAVYQRWMEEQKDALRDELTAAHHWELEEEQRSHQLQLENATCSLQAQLQVATAELVGGQRSHQVQLENATNSLQAQLRAALTALGEERMAHVLTREKAAVAQKLSRGEEQTDKGSEGVRPSSSAWSGCGESLHSARDREHREEVTDENVQRFVATSVTTASPSLPPYPQQKPVDSKLKTTPWSSTFQPRNTKQVCDPSRLSELQRRNSIAPPHLRSSYPVETQTKPESPRSSNRAIQLCAAPSLNTTSTLLQQHTSQPSPWQHTSGRPSDLAEESSRDKDDDRRKSLAFNLETGSSDRQIPERLRLRMEAAKVQREERQHARLEAAQKLKQQQEAAKKSKVKRKPLTSTTNNAKIK